MSDFHPFTVQYRVYDEDVDCGGRMYHTNYLKFCQRAVADFITGPLHTAQRSIYEKTCKSFVLNRYTCKFFAPVGKEEVVTISCIPCKADNSSFDIYQEILNAEGTLLFALYCTMVFIDARTNTPETMPEHIRPELEARFVPDDFRFRVKPY